MSKMNTKWWCLYTTWRVEKVSFFAFSALFIWITQTGHTENLHSVYKKNPLLFVIKTNMPVRKKVKFSPVQHGIAASSVSSLPGQDTFDRTSNLPSSVVSGQESLKVKDCYLNLQHYSLHY